MLCTVTVVNVPVNDRYLAEPQQRFRPFNGNGNIGEETKPHRLIRQAVVSWRPRQRIGVIQLPFQHCFHRGTGQPGGKAGDFITARPQRRFFAEHAAAVIADWLKTLKIAIGMDPPQVLKANAAAALHSSSCGVSPETSIRFFIRQFGLRRLRRSRCQPAAAFQPPTGSVTACRPVLCQKQRSSKKKPVFLFTLSSRWLNLFRRTTPPQSKSATAARWRSLPPAADWRWRSVAVRPPRAPDRRPFRRRSPD